MIKTWSEFKTVSSLRKDDFMHYKSISLVLALLCISLTGCGLEKTNSVPTSELETTILPLDTTSDNWRDSHFILDGKTYQLPINYADLKEAGWNVVYEKEVPKKLKSGESAYFVEIKNEKYQDSSVYVTFQNLSYDDSILSQGTSLEDCDVVDISFYNYGNNLDLELANGITFHSSADDLVNAYGKDDMTTSTLTTGDIVSASYYYNTYEYKDTWDVSSSFTFENDELQYVELGVSNFNWPFSSH